MNIKLHPRLKNGYTISIIVHIALLLIFAFQVIKPNLPNKWHSFVWELPDKPITSTTISSKGIVPDAPRSVAEEKAKEKVESTPSNTSPSVMKEQPRVLESPVLETPSTSFTTPTDPVRISRDRSTSALRSLGNTLPGGNLGFSASLEQGDGDAYIITQPKPLIVPDVEGEVLLEFKLSPKGGVDMNSVVVLTYSTASYVEALRQVLPQWRFGFRGAYNSERKYRVRCKFVVNED